MREKIPLPRKKLVKPERLPFKHATFLGPGSTIGP